MRDQFLPKDMEPGVFLDALHKISGVGPSGDKKWTPPDKSERIMLGKYLGEAIQAYMERPVKKYQEKIQAFMKTTDLPDMVTRSFDTFYDVDNYDLLYQNAYKDVSGLIEPSRSYWEIATIDTGVVWKLIPEGHSVTMEKVTGTRTTVDLIKLGCGISITDELIRFRRFTELVDLVEEMRRSYMQDLADRYYTLLVGASHTTIAASVGGTEIENDINSINGAAYDLLDGLKDTRNLPMSHEVLIYITPQAQARVQRALGELSQSFAQSTGRVIYNVRPLFSFNSNLPSAASGETYAGIMCVGGFKSQSATLMGPTFYTDEDILSLSYIRTCFSYIGGACADTNQILTFGLT
jgi:hypothetical protein